MSNPDYGMDLIENTITTYGGYNTLKKAFTDAKISMRRRLKKNG